MMPQEGDLRKRQLVTRASYASVAVAFLLIVLKLISWWYSGSISLLATLADSVFDAAASILNLLAIRLALSPADDEHRHGHGKVEGLAALAQAAFVAGFSLFLFLQSLDRFVSPTKIEATGLGVAVMIISIATTYALTRYQLRVVKQTASLVVEADALHYLSDMGMNLLVILALLLVDFTGFIEIDGFMGMILSCFVFYCAGRIAKKAFDILLDRELPDEEREAICKEILANAAVKGLHDLRTRQSGPDKVIQFHLEMDGSLSLYETYSVVVKIEKEIREKYGVVDVTIFPEPDNIEIKKGSRQGEEAALPRGLKAKGNAIRG